jgi:hypothetical protein
VRESFDINRENAHVFCSPGFYLQNTTSLRKEEIMAMLRIKVCMNIHNLYSLRYLCTFSYSKNNSKFTGSLLKIYVCDVHKTLLSMKVKYVYVIQNRKYTGGAVQEKSPSCEARWCSVGKILANRRHVRFPDLCQNSHAHNYRELLTIENRWQNDTLTHKYMTTNLPGLVHALW